jgi:hypothetical protein
MVASNIVLAKKTLELWQAAIWTVKQAQKKFLAAYEATLDDVMPSWKDSWQTDPLFPAKLVEAEDYIKAICRQNGMSLTTFNRYRRAARASVLGDVPFSMANNFSLRQIRQIKQGETTAAKLKRQRRISAAENLVARSAAVLPLPTDQENPVDYIESIGGRFADYLRTIKAQLGEAAFTALTLEIKRRLALNDLDHDRTHLPNRKDQP